MTTTHQQRREALLAEAKQQQREIVRQIEGTAVHVRDESRKVLFITGTAIAVFGALQIAMVVFRPSQKVISVAAPSAPVAAAAYSPKKEDAPMVKMLKKLISDFLLGLAKRTLQNALERYAAKSGAR